MEKLGHFEVEEAVEERPKFLVLEDFVAGKFDELEVVVEKLLLRYVFLVELFFENDEFWIAL